MFCKFFVCRTKSVSTSRNTNTVLFNELGKSGKARNGD